MHYTLQRQLLSFHYSNILMHSYLRICWNIILCNYDWLSTNKQTTFFIIKPTDALFTKFILAKKWTSVCFGQFLCPSSRVHSLCAWHWYMSYRFEDSFQAGPSWSCSKAVFKPVWHIQVPSAQWVTPDDGQRNCPKRAEVHFLAKINLVNSASVGFAKLTFCSYLADTRMIFFPSPPLCKVKKLQNQFQIFIITFLMCEPVPSGQFSHIHNNKIRKKRKKERKTDRQTFVKANETVDLPITVIFFSPIFSPSLKILQL